MKWARLTQHAIEDIDLARAWYEQHGVGNAFIDQIEHTLTSISSKPELYAAIFNDIRRAGLRRFPYGLFHMNEADGPVVIACLHHKRGRIALLVTSCINPQGVQ